MTDGPTARLIAEAIDTSGKTQREIANEIGFERPNVVSMLKSGEMRMPVERIPAFSRATGIDPHLLTRAAMMEFCRRLGALWDVRHDPSLSRAQIYMKGLQPVVERFKRLCRSERRAYLEMLEQLMDIRDAALEAMFREAFGG
ncbi:XRE family transcriptional regulator [Thalassococcus profundi]|uniref:XRE family transcriptional regulator n=1 Tax=Thalassococcus profundi TaxID=2282382 RepID=A0A369TLA0_9RHOB|nr:XRE family transcriptional regulator [Thalassococcus profundi]RDD66038.1 XRE family transcriptional regulator [Thalassococcus profundi]